MQFENTLEFALSLDSRDQLYKFRDQFYIPKHKGSEVVYLTGNSLGLQPKKARNLLLEELDDWALHGVEGHFKARRPWKDYHELLAAPAARIVGALPEEVVMMNGLTTNIHLMLVSFYRPIPGRFKIICEQKAFPSDRYALNSQIQWHGFNPADALVEVGPREGEHTIRHEDLLAAIDKHAGEVALVFIGGVNYYSGQLFNMESIAMSGHAAGALVGFDLAHAAGNVKLALHDWNADFACWCTYKYLNSGPGSVAGAFVHQRHFSDNTLPRFAGWWGHDKDSRFLMEPEYRPILTAEGWQLSNAPVFCMAPHLASLSLFDEAGMDQLVAKSTQLTAYLEFVIGEALKGGFSNAIEILTPKNPDERGAQLSLLIRQNGRQVYEQLTDAGVVVDWREPNVIRLAPVPMYNMFRDVYSFGSHLSTALQFI